MNTGPAGATEWESWPADVALREVTSFAERAETLTGLSEEQLKRQLGLPGEEAPGTRWESATREVILQADRDLRYFDLLPHVVVSFAIAGGLVARVGYMPKWRRCPAGFASNLRGAYAPE
jgi:hypothetical protein